MTSRNERMAHAGDTFEAFGLVFKITKVEEMRLWDIANLYFLEEGCESPKAFVEIWEKIHPKVGYVPSHVVWTHTFKRASITKKEFHFTFARK